jgi:hypothetical protein
MPAICLIWTGPCILPSCRLYKEHMRWGRDCNLIMLIALVAFSLSHRVHALPISAIEQRTPLSCDDSCNRRTIWSICWSCLATIFACTWVAIHPNIPESNPNPHWYSRILRRARIMAYALIAPEFVILWAWRQLYIASKKPRRLKSVFCFGESDIAW